jgi:hypothetical protein
MEKIFIEVVTVDNPVPYKQFEEIKKKDKANYFDKREIDVIYSVMLFDDWVKEFNNNFIENKIIKLETVIRNKRIKHFFRKDDVLKIGA